jgi:hypothetical protein
MPPDRREAAVRDDRPENKHGMFQMASVAEIPRVTGIRSTFSGAALSASSDVTRGRRRSRASFWVRGVLFSVSGIAYTWPIRVEASAAAGEKRDGKERRGLLRWDGK